MDLLLSHINQLKQEQALQRAQEDDERIKQEELEEQQILRSLEKAKSLYVNRTKRTNFSGFISSQLKNSNRKFQERKKNEPRAPPPQIFILLEDYDLSQKKQDDDKNRKMDQLIFNILSNTCFEQPLETSTELQDEIQSAEKTVLNEYYSNEKDTYFVNRIVLYQHLINVLKNRIHQIDLMDWILISNSKTNIINTLRKKIVQLLGGNYTYKDSIFQVINRTLKDKSNLKFVQEEFYWFIRDFYDSEKSISDHNKRMIMECSILLFLIRSGYISDKSIYDKYKYFLEKEVWENRFRYLDRQEPNQHTDLDNSVMWLNFRDNHIIMKDQDQINSEYYFFVRNRKDQLKQ